MATQIMLAGLPEPVREFRFLPPRRFRFDFAFPDAMVALEVDGGLYTRGRHQSITGYSNDCEKINLAQIHGWVVLRVVREQIEDGRALRWLQEALAGTGVEVGG